MPRAWPFLLAIAAAARADDFADGLYPALERAQCRLCHNDNGVASRTRLQFPPEDASPAGITAFGLRLRALVDAANPAESLLFRKPTNRLAHTGPPRRAEDGPPRPLHRHPGRPLRHPVADEVLRAGVV